MPKPFLKSVIACSLAMFGGQSWADDAGGAGIPWGPVSVYPSVGLTVGNDDNLLLSNANRLSTSFEVLSPQARFEAQHRGDIYALTYHADLGRYNNSSPDDYNDQSLVGQADTAISSRASLKVRPEYTLGHDPRGTTYGIFTPVPNRWRNAGASGVYGYGSEGAKGRIEISAGFLGTKYLNNRYLTYAYDKNTTDFGGTFFYRVMPKTSLLFQASNTRYAYDNAGSLVPNNTVRNYMVGAKWEATAKTTGDVRIGQIQQRYDNGTVPNFTGTGWNGTIQWRPREYSRVKLDLTKQPEQTTLAGSSSYVVTSSSADWAYDWNSRFTSHVNLARITENFGGLALSTRNNSYGLEADYRIRRWLKGALSWTSWAKAANQAAYSSFFDYNRNVVMLTLTGTL